MNAPTMDFSKAGRKIDKITVRISYDIIHLFSEGLYKSPHKAIEELVCNSFDADARCVRILLPDPKDKSRPDAPLWVIDDGHGMDADGFHQLWRVADSPKANANPASGRAPIGKFGIGKLAAYVIAWRLVHLSRVNGKYFLTEMDFTAVRKHQADDPEPVTLSLRELDEGAAKRVLSDVEERDPDAWRLLFSGQDGNDSWTVVGLTHFRELYNRLQTGTLRWVISTGLPLESDFKVYLDGELIESSRVRKSPLREFSLKKDLPGIGRVVGTARIYKEPLTGGKSARISRSHGFFVKVRKRVINLEDELFGISQLNLSAWSRFMLEVEADGLNEHLLSSREGVKDSQAVRVFRDYLHESFNKCRVVYAEFERKQQTELDLMALLSEEVSSHILEPLLRGVRETAESGSDSFYFSAPRDLEGLSSITWLERTSEKISRRPFEDPTFRKNGSHAVAVQYDPAARRLKINVDHPFVDKLTKTGMKNGPAKLFAPSEVLLEGLLQEHGVQTQVIAEILRDRDRILRLMAGAQPSTPVEVRRLLQVANQDPTALERATGEAFRILGLEYERRGGNKPGTDGVLIALLGRQEEGTGEGQSFRIVYDAKCTSQSTVRADKIDPASLEDFRVKESAAYGFFIASKYAGEKDVAGKLNSKMFAGSALGSYSHLTLLKIEHLDRLVRMHFRYGLTLTDLRKMFQESRTVLDVDKWISRMECSLKERDIPIRILLDVLEGLKSDTKAIPNVYAARYSHADLKQFEANRLIARLNAVEQIIGSRWIQVDRYGAVVMNQTSGQILAEVQRHFGELDIFDKSEIE